MKNSILIIFLVLSSLKLYSQSLKLDTIYANEHKNVALFFPSPIQQGITGSENFVFTYNREKEQHFGLLQATPGKESNLLVISDSGAIFSYFVKYSGDLKKLNYFIADTNSIGNVFPVSEGIKDVIKDPGLKEDSDKSLSVSDEIYFRKSCSYLIEKKQGIGRIKKRKNDVILRVENIVFDKEHLFFVLEIKNRSTIDYELNFLELSVQTRKNGKRKSMQKLVQEPSLKYQMPGIIKEGQSTRFVYVMPKFSIADDKEVVLDLNEKNGERDLKLKVKQRYINNPN
ncbi:DUF4138 domain-containing protein [Gillisia sp. JM1]|uniref:DUF4138 domain-containing protein n=1 Tax=Gillisia sp. JM1 TaxID=1283286 RepID=UPI0003FEC9A6|nr:DUF4138 domain-containing protein [Gillisia sp. JM1]